jgi:DNA primase
VNKRRVDPDRLAEWAEAELDVRNRMGDEWQCVCPFHQDSGTNKPDLYLNVRKGVFICMSTACGEKGSAFELVAKISGIDLEAVAAELSMGGKRRVQAVRERLAEFRSPEVAPRQISQALIDEMRSTRYWASERGLASATIDAFDLGFDDETSTAVIPYRDADGVARYLIRRATLPDHDGPRYRYPKGFPLRSAVFNLHRVDPRREVIVTEGSIDAMRVWQAGYTNVVALLGSGVFDQQLAALRSLRVVTFFDRDPAGEAATRRMVAQHSRLFRIARYPRNSEAKDPDGLSDEEIAGAIDRAIPSSTWSRSMLLSRDHTW